MGPCPFHTPSEHHMRTWPINWREDRKLVERICPHGVGHPDPDALAFLRLVGKEERGVHGCCSESCCDPESYGQQTVNPDSEEEE